MLISHNTWQNPEPYVVRNEFCHSVICLPKQYKVGLCGFVIKVFSPVSSSPHLKASAKKIALLNFVQTISKLSCKKLKHSGPVLAHNPVSVKGRFRRSTEISYININFGFTCVVFLLCACVEGNTPRQQFLSAILCYLRDNVSEIVYC